MAFNARSCHGLSSATLFPEGRPDRVVALVGNPNVGKSTLFNQLTGLGVVTAHYAGKTAEINVGRTRVGEFDMTVMDLPGTYGLAGDAEAAWTSRRALLEVAPDVVVVVLDATNLARNTVLALEVLELQLPTVVVANLSDQAARLGIAIDSLEFSERLGAPVFRAAAVDGIGVSAIMEYVALVTKGEVPLYTPSPAYTEPFEGAIRPLVEAVARSRCRPYDLPPRAIAFRLLSGDTEVIEAVRAAGVPGVSRLADEARSALAAIMRATSASVLARERHAFASGLAADVTTVDTERRSLVDLARLATRPLTGTPTLVGMLGVLFLTLFFVGEVLAGVVSSLWGAYVSPVVQSAITALAGEGVFAETLRWGFDAGIEASLAIGIPYILTFYFLLAILEDSGYLNAVAFLADRMMHRVGLHGRAIIPMVAGFGCSVPAVLSVRLLRTDRERFIAATLVAMVPCSARTAVILGAVGHYFGVLPALGVYAVTAVVAAVVGTVLNRFLSGSSEGMVMEMFPFRRPAGRIVVRKAWQHFREFVVIAMPIVVAGSIVLGGLYETGRLSMLSDPMAPVISGWLGLPAVAGLTLLFGLLRKEFALQLLATLAIATAGVGSENMLSFMTPTNVFVYVLVNTLAFPCISTLAVLGRTLGWRRAVYVLGMTVGVALVVGGFFARALPLIGVA